MKEYNRTGGNMIQHEIVIFLSKVKRLIRDGKRKFISERTDRDYVKDLNALGITEEEAWNHVLTLKPSMYFPDERPFYKTNQRYIHL